MVARVARMQFRLYVVATPWTAPKWMKQSAQVRGGALRDDAVDQYAELLVAQADQLGAAGVFLDAFTLGNEPGYGADYFLMTMSASQQARLGQLVGLQLHDWGFELWAGDHNWVDWGSYDEVFASVFGDFDAAAFHCYVGTLEQMAGVAVPPLVMECIGTISMWSEAFAWDMRHLVEESIVVGLIGLMTWNLAVDPSGGPRDATFVAGCAFCCGLLIVAGGEVEAGSEFYVLAQVARAADFGARVVGSRASAGISSVAFANPDGTIGVVVLNDIGQDRVVGVTVGGGKEARTEVRAGELLTVRSLRTQGLGVCFPCGRWSRRVRLS